jgi:hypothetical protein
MDRDTRNILNLKQPNLFSHGEVSTDGMSDGQITISKGYNQQTALSLKKDGKIYKTNMSSNGNQYVDRDITIKNNLNVSGTSNLNIVDIDGNTQIDGSVTIGVDDTGYDVKFFGDTASAYSMWDASEDRYTLANPTGAPTLRLLRNDSSVATNNSLGKIEFAGLDDEEDVGCMIEGQARGTWNGGSDIPSGLLFWVADDGSTDLKENLRLDFVGSRFNKNKYSDLDFSVGSDNKERCLFVDAGDECVAIGFDSAPTIDGSAVGQLIINNGTKPSAHTDNQVYIGAENSAGTGTDTLSTLSLFLEEDIDATALNAVGTLSHRIPIWLNGTCYWLYLDPV